MWPFGVLVFSALLLFIHPLAAWNIPEDKSKCPKVKALRNFDLNQMLGFWYVVEYYASSEEAPEYSCMRAELSTSTETPSVFMNFSYSFMDDPDKDLLTGNITWELPNPAQPAHWVHAEDTYEGIYNTFVLDWDQNFGLLLHCAEKTGSTRYLSSLILSRTLSLGPNVISYLREKLPAYDVDLTYMFTMSQNDCPQFSNKKTTKRRKNILKYRKRVIEFTTKNNLLNEDSP